MGKVNSYFVCLPGEEPTTKIRIEAKSGQDAAQEFCRRLNLSSPGAVTQNKHVTVIVDTASGLSPTREYRVEAWVQTFYLARLVG